MITACDGPSPPSPTPSNSPTPSGTATPSAAATGTHAPAGFVLLSDVDSTILTDIRYATPHNFVGRPITGYREPLCLLARRAADALHQVQSAALAQGKSLKVYDCYRPQQAVDDFVRWAKSPAEQQMKAEFYPQVNKSVLFAQGYIASPTAHSRGSAVDLTLVAVPPPSQRPYVPGEALVSCTAPYGQRFPDNTVDMGTGFDCFDPLAHTADSRVTGAARENRTLLNQLMSGGGFVNYPGEWWHYRLENEPYPDTYFDFPVERSALPTR
jgi:zinc D-Ala-D-Ala dipeptidase